jgi:membrane protease YdiL (CAAX protease family)
MLGGAPKSWRLMEGNMQNDLVTKTRNRSAKHSIPYQFFVVAFTWSWLLWLPLVLVGSGILPIGKDLLSALTIPVTILAAFGPAAGAFYCLRTLHGKGAMRQYLRSLADLRLGWQAWLVPVFVLGGSTWLAWVLPELWGEPRLAMLLPSALVFPPYVLFVILLGGGQEELGWRGYVLDPMEERLGPWLGNLVAGSSLGYLALAAILHSGYQSGLHALCWVYATHNRLFLVLRLGTPGFWQTHTGRVDCSRVGQCVCPSVSHTGNGRGGSTDALLDLGYPDTCDRAGYNAPSLTQNLERPLFFRRRARWSLAPPHCQRLAARPDSLPTTGPVLGGQVIDLCA